MTVIEINGSGQQVIEPSREEDIITPEKLGKLIAAEVGRELRKVVETVFAKADELATRKIDRFAILTTGKVDKTIQAAFLSMQGLMEKAKDELREGMQRMVNDFVGYVNGVQDRIEEWYKHSLNKLNNHFASITARVEKASVESLTAIIGQEIEQYELQELIRSEVKSAVKEAVFEAMAIKNKTKVHPAAAHDEQTPGREADAPG